MTDIPWWIRIYYRCKSGAKTVQKLKITKNKIPEFRLFSNNNKKQKKTAIKSLCAPDFWCGQWGSNPRPQPWQGTGLSRKSAQKHTKRCKNGAKMLNRIF